MNDKKTATNRMADIALNALDDRDKKISDLRAKLEEAEEDKKEIAGTLDNSLKCIKKIEQERDYLRRQVKEIRDEAASAIINEQKLRWKNVELLQQNAALRGMLEESLPILKQMEKNGYRLISRSCGYDVIEGICAICESSKHKDSCHLQKLLLQINQAITAPADARTAVIDTAKLYIGVPFVWGGTSPSGFDCSGFTQYVMQESGITIPRTVAEQYRCGTPVSKDNLKPGDLIFFATYEDGATHVGFYIGDDNFIHASQIPEPGQVITSLMTEPYYAERYIGARCYLAQQALTASGDNRYSKIEEAAKVVRDIAQCYKDGDCGFNEVIEVIDDLASALGEGEK